MSRVIKEKIMKIMRIMRIMRIKKVDMTHIIIKIERTIIEVRIDEEDIITTTINPIIMTTTTIKGMRDITPTLLIKENIIKVDHIIKIKRPSQSMSHMIMIKIIFSKRKQRS